MHPSLKDEEVNYVINALVHTLESLR